MSDKRYLGPWLKFTRARDKDGFPIISVTKDGKTWTRLREDESWDIIVMLRGPDQDSGSGRLKKHTTAPIRGLFIPWKVPDLAWPSQLKNVGRGAYAVLPVSREWHGEGSSVNSMTGESYHFRGHWKRAWVIIGKYLGGWPLDEEESDDKTAKQ